MVVDIEFSPFFFAFFNGGRGAFGSERGLAVPLPFSFFECKSEMKTACNLQNGGACFEIRMSSH